MRYYGLRAAVRLSAIAMLLIGIATLRPAIAAGMIDPGLPNLVATLLPRVVNITTTRYKAIDIPPGQSVVAQAATPDQSIWYGSGFICTSDGYVVTNKHVVHNGVSFKVTMSDGSQYPASLIGEAACCDVAVIKITSARPFPAVTLGDSDKLRQGDFVIAIGNPLNFSSTVTTGVISALNRDMHFTEFDDYLQTDATINEGNSGGPMFNAEGEVVGINSALETTTTSTGSIGIGFAIPINDAKFLIAHLHDYEAGTMRPSYLGARVQTLTPDLASTYGLPGPWGAIIVQVIDGGPAAQAGLRPGDIITSFLRPGNLLATMGNEYVKDSRALMRNVVETMPGTTVALGIWRGGTQQTEHVTLAALPPGHSYPTFLGQPGVAKPELRPEALVNFGLQLEAITPELRTKYHLNDNQQGAVVTGVAIGSAAANAGINAGAVIVQVRDSPVTSPEDVVKYADAERVQKREFVPMLLSESTGLRWMPLPLD
ncbi:MAG TPA: trypsin-like peptidase domain-containing protein [Acetobacteraceae bacterium]